MPGQSDLDLTRRLEQALRNIPRRQRQTFEAHRLDGMSYAEIASRTGLTERQVARNLAKALYKVSKQLDGLRLHWWEQWF
jgi:RNA polymerase sigma-70 factor (ECF subfamily)